LFTEEGAIVTDMQRKVLVLRNDPASSEATGALHLAATLPIQGRAITVVLIQDAVLCALLASDLESAESVRTLATDGARCYYLSDDLAMRGYAPRDVAPGCLPVDDSGLVDLLPADGASVAGAF
jgi:sulfur transfer complex TusBCD TusB component (DsrH family)